MTSAAPSLTKACPRCGGSYEDAAVFCPKDGERLQPACAQPPDPYIGTVISGDIEILGVAGSGAMGRVYRAHQRGIDRAVAVKILHRELSGNAQLVHRFHREAKIASKLQHPHVVEVHLAGQLPDGAMYIVMEYLEGQSVGAALEQGPFSLPRALDVVMQICDAVGEGHALGIVHRDLKPENVMLVRRGEIDDWVKVLDFGIARVQLGEQSMETAAGKIFGTARYISPEGAAGNRVEAPGDVYAIATLLYQMLAGRTPFEGAPIGLLVKHIHEPPPPLKSWPAAASVPDPIAQLVMRNLAKDPRQRAQDARAFAADLAAAAEASGITIPMAHAARRLNHLPGVDPTIDDAHPPPPPVLPVVEKKPPPEKQPVRPRWLAPAIALSFVAAIGITAIVTRRLTSPDPDHAAFIERTRRALADGHYVAPPGENVYDLVEQGQKTWPNDITLRELRSQAEHEMITMAMAAHASGDIVGARNLARDAYRLDSTDNSARFMRAQAEDDLASIVSGAGIDSGPPRLVFESPPVVRTGEKVVMTCRIVPGQAGPKAKVTSIKLSIFPNGQTTGGVPVSLVQTDPWHVRAEIVAPSVQSWDVTFEAAVDGTFVRAMRDLDVIP